MFFSVGGRDLSVNSDEKEEEYLYTFFRQLFSQVIKMLQQTLKLKQE